MSKKSKDKEKQVYGDFVCRDCQCSDYEVISEIQPTDFAGTLADGKRFTRVIRHRVRCTGCDLPSHLMRWEFDPSAWKE